MKWILNYRLSKIQRFVNLKTMKRFTTEGGDISYYVSSPNGNITRSLSESSIFDATLIHNYTVMRNSPQMTRNYTRVNHTSDIPVNPTNCIDGTKIKMVKSLTLMRLTI